MMARVFFTEKAIRRPAYEVRHSENADLAGEKAVLPKELPVFPPANPILLAENHVY